MGKNNYFQFKKFRIEQEKSAMKVGVDGVLLGAWSDVSGANKILDVGTGTGLIALMLAQRSTAQITAIEIEKNAALEAQQNCAASSWGNRIEVLHTSLQEFVKTQPREFDLIVSNPPFFTRASKAATGERTLARHNDSLPFSELMLLTSELLSVTGTLSIIVPAENLEEINAEATLNGFHLKRITHVRPKPSKKINRLLFQWTKTKEDLLQDELCIYENDGSFTKEYIGLTCDFYLNF